MKIQKRQRTISTRQWGGGGGATEGNTANPGKGPPAAAHTFFSILPQSQIPARFSGLGNTLHPETNSDTK